MTNEKYIDLCIKEITGNIDDSEKEVLNNWLNLSAENKAEYEKLKSVWLKIEPDEIEAHPDIDAEWSAISEKLKLYQRERQKSVWEKLADAAETVLMPRLKPVAAVVLLLIISIIGIAIFNNESIEYKLTEVSTANGVHKRVSLPDGSYAVLNSASSLKYSTPFKDDIREVELHGEAFFSVEKAGRPFIIKTKNARVTVLGTEFNVWSREEKTEVFVKNGKVELSSQSENSKGVTLTKNELSAVVENNEPRIPQIVDSEYLLGWLEGELVFNKSSVQEIVGELERRYDISIALENDSLEDLTLTGMFKNENPDTVLTMICTALDIDYDKEEEGYTLFSK